MIVFLIIAGIAGFLAWIYWPEIIGAGWSPTPLPHVKRMLKMARVGPEDVVYDLGCGDGRIITIAAGEFGARAVGIEADPFRFFLSFLRVRFSGVRDKVSVRWGNFFNHNLKDATVVTVFLSTKANRKLKEKLKKELSPGTRVVSYYWIFDDLKMTECDPFLHLYLYEIGR